MQPSPALHHTACTIADSAASVAVSRRAMSVPMRHSMTGLGAMVGLGKPSEDDEDPEDDNEDSTPSFHPGLMAKLDPSHSRKPKSAPTADDPEAVRAAVRLQRA